MAGGSPEDAEAAVIDMCREGSLEVDAATQQLLVGIDMGWQQLMGV